MVGSEGLAWQDSQGQTDVPAGPEVMTIDTPQISVILLKLQGPEDHPGSTPN